MDQNASKIVSRLPLSRVATSTVRPLGRGLPHFLTKRMQSINRLRLLSTATKGVRNVHTVVFMRHG